MGLREVTNQFLLRMNKSIVVMLVTYIVAVSSALAQTVDIETPIYEGTEFSIYPSTPYWCQSSRNRFSSNITLDVVYEVPNASRNNVLFQGSDSDASKNKFFKDAIVPIIIKHCLRFSGFDATARLRLNTRADWSKNNRRYWDQIEFTYHKAGYNLRGRLTGHDLSSAAVADKEREKQLVEEDRQNSRVAGNSFRALSGSEYLLAIHKGNFEKQSNLARQYLTEMSTSIGGAMAHLMGGLAQTRDARIAKQELTVLEEVISHYMTQYSRYGESCLSEGWFERRFTHELPDDVVFDDFGIEIDRIDGGTTTTVFKLNKEFTEVCDNLCNTGGALVISAMTGNTMSRDKNYALGDVFRGVIQMLDNKGCDSQEVKQFEKSLLEMYVKERGIPLRERNTLGNVINR